MDFKFSDGYHAKVVVEIKKSTGSVDHGYKKQLERYKKASRTDYAIFVVIDYGHNEQKIRGIQKLRQNIIDNGGRASNIFIIDARKKPSASRDGKLLF